MVRIIDVFPHEEAANSKDQTLLTAPEDLKNDLRSRGFSHALLSFWVSKLNDEQVAALPIELPPPRFLAIRFLTQFHDDSISLRGHDMVVRNNHVAFLRSIKKRRVEGKYLFLGAAFQEENDASEASRIIDKMVIETRLAGGIGAAAEEVYRAIDHINNDQFSFQFGPIVIQHYFLDGPDDDNTWNTAISKFTARHFSMSDDAATLFNLAVQQKDQGTRFLLLWLALESQVGVGPRVKQFFEHSMKSKRLSSLVARLGKIRGGLAHQGKFKAENGDELLLFFLLRISCLADSSEQKSAIKSLEMHLRNM